MTKENPWRERKMRILSWGKGVQSTTLAAMSAKGLLPHLDTIIFSDLEWERERTYEVGYWYERYLAKAGLDVQTLHPGNIRLLGAKEHIHMPFWTVSGAPLQRQCTCNFKVRPIRRRVRELLGYHPSRAPAPPPGAVEQWIGFSLDERHRMRPSSVQFCTNRFPLIEMGMTRWDCIKWLEDEGLPVPIKSSCIGCPYRSAPEWLRMREENICEFDSAIEFDEKNRHNVLAANEGVTSDALYIWQGRNRPEPLANADLTRIVRKPKHYCQFGLCLETDIHVPERE